MPPADVARSNVPDPLVEQILKQESWEKAPGATSKELKAEAVLKEVPLQTPFAQARAIMARHGFVCWSGVSDNENSGVYLQCKAYKQKDAHYADRIVVKLFYERERIVRVVVTIDHHVPHSDQGFWSIFG
jgi:hypothetical protein